MDKHSLSDTSLPQPLQSDSRGKQFWDDINSQLSSPPPTEASKRDLDVGLGDVARGVGAGALDLVGGIGELARQASNFGKENAGKQGGDYLEQARANMASKLSPVLDKVAKVGDLAKSGAESLTEGMSGDAKEAISRSLIDETPEGHLTMGDGAGDIDVWAMKFAQGIGSMVPTLGAGAATAIGRAVTVSMLKRGVSQKLAEQVAAKTVHLSTGAAMATGVTGSVGSAGVNTRDTVMGMSFDELAASDTFRQSFTRIDQDQQTQHLSDEEKLALAREETANLASRTTMSDAKVWGAAAMGSMMGDAMLFKMLAGKAATGGMLKGAAKGAAGEGISETLEEGVQQYTVNESLNEVAAADIDPMKGVVSSALEGGLIGMGTGGALGGVGGLRGGKPQADGESSNLAATSTVEEVAPVEQGEPVPADTVSAQEEPGLAPAVDTVAEPVMPVGEQNPLGPSASHSSQFPGVFERDQRGILRVKGDVEALAAWAEQADVPYITDGEGIAVPAKYAGQAEQAIRGYQRAVTDPASESAQPVDRIAFRQVDPVEETPAFLRQSIERAGGETDSIFGPLKSLRITRKGEPFANEKVAAMASRKGKEIPVPLNGGGFGVAEIAEVEQAAAVPQGIGQEMRDNAEQQPLAQAVDTGYREVIPATQPQTEVSNEQAPQVLAVGSEGQGDQLIPGEPAAASTEPANAGLTYRAGSGDPADYAAAPPVPDGQQQDDQTLTAPAIDAGAAVSEVAQPEPVAPKPVAAPTPWSEMIDNPDGTITLKGEVPLIKQWVKDNGVKAIPRRDGMLVSTASVAKVLKYVASAASEPMQQMEWDVVPTSNVRMSQQQGLSVDEAQRIADNFMQEYNGNIPIQIRVKQNQEELYGPGTSKEEIGYGIEGSYSPERGVLGLVSGVLRSEADARRVLRHEALGHYGLDTFTPKDKSALLQKLIDAKNEKWIAPVWKQIAGDSVYGKKSDLHQAEEVFAHLSEKELPPRTIQAWNDIKTEFSRLLRKAGLVKGPIKEHELDSLIKAVGKGIRNGERTKQNIRGDQEVIGKQADEPSQDDKPERIISFSKQAMSQGEKPAKHLTRKEAELVTKMWFKQYRGASGIDVQIHATQAELETALGLAAKDGLIRRAAFDDDTGTLHVAADTIANPKRMREILRHEVLAHYGLANVLGDGEYTKLISRLIKSKKDPSMKPVWDWVNTHYADEDIGVQAEEVVAHLAELEMGSWGRGWDRVVAWVTRALRAVGFVPDGITAAETRTLIEGLGKKMRRADGGMVTAEGDRLWFSAERSPWGKDFPEVILHGRLADATGHPDYAAAKGGDDAAARRLVSDVLSPDAIRQLKKVIGNREAIALGVHAEEAVSRNAIPQAMADVLGKVLGIEVSVDIVQAAKVGRTAQDGFGRLANQPSFDGAVRTDKPYLIMDDTLTQGGTLANLKGYIENRGGEVLAATALTGKQYSAKIAIDSSTLEQLRDQYDGTGLEAWWHNRFGYSFDSLTESEGRYLLRAKDADKVRDRVTAAGYASPARGEHESARDDGSLPPDGLKFSQSNTAADDALQKLNLGPKPDIIDKTKTNLDKLRKVERSVVKSWLDRFIKKANTELLDALAPIKYAEDAAGINDAADSGYVAARMATGAASTMQATMLYGLPEWKDGVIQKKAGTGEKDALLGIFSDLGADLHNWLGWMAGHRAELLMEQGRENLLSEQDIAALKGLGKGKEAKFMEAKARWNRLNAATLDLAQEAGLFTKEARAEFESEWYIPFFRESDDGDVIAPFKPKGIANQNAGIKKLKGGEANTNDLLENIFTSTSKLIDASMKNMAAQKTVWNLADTGLIEVVAKPNMMDWRALKNGKDLITVKLEGEDYMIRVDDPDLYRAMTFFDRQPFGAMVNVAAKAKRLLTAGVTASPEFMLRNFLRDSLSSWAISKDGFKPVIDSIKGVKKTLAMEGSTIDVMFSGASFLGGYVNGNDPTAMADTVRKSLRRKGMTPEQIARYEKSIIRNAAQAKGVVANVWEKYNRFGEAFENGNREAVYDAAIKAGKSHAQAAFESKDLMDFSMLGAARAIQGAAMILPFFNARLQGLGKLTRELRDNPHEIAKRAGMITAMSLGLLAANWDDERYEELPDWDKDANWHFFVGDQHFRIPKPFEIGVMFGTIPERMVRAMGDKDTGAQFGKAVARAIGDTFALNPTPQIVKPMVEAAFNYDTFRGGPIDSPQDLAVKAEARYNEQTSLLMRELGELSGFSPKQLEHLVIGYTGTMGSYVMAAADGLIRAARPGESASWRADEIPLVKAVYRGTGPAKSTQHMEEFYRMLNEVNQLKRTVDQYRSEGLTDKANELLDEQGGILKARRSLSRTQQQVRVVRNRIELIQRDRVLSAEEKRRRIDELLSRRNDLVYQAVNNNRLFWDE